MLLPPYFSKNSLFFYPGSAGFHVFTPCHLAGTEEIDSAANYYHLRRGGQGRRREEEEDGNAPDISHKSLIEISGQAGVTC